MSRLRQLSICIFLVLCVSGAWATVSIDETTQNISLAGQLSLLVDDAGTLNLDDAIAAASQGKFHPLPGFLNRGYTQSTSWLSLSIQNTTAVAQAPRLQLQPHYVDEMDVYVQQGGDPTRPDNYRSYRLGDHTPMAEKPQLQLSQLLMATPIQLAPKASIQVFIRVHTKSNHSLSLNLLSTSEATAHAIRSMAWQSAYLALAIALAVINLLLFIRLRDWVYGIYGFYLLTLFSSELVLDGMLGFLLPSSAHLLSDWLAGVAAGLGIGSISLFAIALFQTAKRHPWAHRYLQLIVALGVSCFLVSGTVWYGSLTQLLMANGLVLTLLLPWLAWQQIRAGEVATGRLFLLAFGATAVGAAFHFLRMLGVLPVNEFTNYALRIPSILHMIIMTMGLSERVLAAEEAALQAARDAESTAMAIAEKMTSELTQSKQQLELAFGSERRMREEQARFIDTISHEYRTPLSILKTHLDVIEARQLLDPSRSGVMASAIQRLQDLFSDALRAHRLGRPPEPRQESIELTQLLDQILTEFQQTNPQCPLLYRPPDRPSHIRGDPGLLQTALRNVIENAVKYRFPADAKHPVTLKLDVGENKVSLSIANDINPALPLNRSELFERHVRGVTRGDQSGLGLGLYLVRRILHDHGGEVSIADTPAHRFELTLTLALAAA